MRLKWEPDELIGSWALGTSMTAHATTTTATTTA
jgi:hypothetical protein